MVGKGEVQNMLLVHAPVNTFDSSCASSGAGMSGERSGWYTAIFHDLCGFYLQQ